VKTPQWKDKVVARRTFSGDRVLLGGKMLVR
jgi:hypothetical protein